MQAAEGWVVFCLYTLSNEEGRKYCPNAYNMLITESAYVYKVYTIQKQHYIFRNYGLSENTSSVLSYNCAKAHVFWNSN